MEKSLKKHYGALIGLIIGTVVGIFTNTMALLLAIIIGESYDQYRSKKCEK